MACSLGALFEDIACQGLSSQHKGIIIDAIATDSRLTPQKSLFVALRGQKTDGALYIGDAVSRGAIAVLAPLEAQPPANIGAVPFIQVIDPRAMLSRLSQRLYDFPARSLRLSAVTGTNGKTTTVYMLAAILSQSGRKVAFWTTNRVGGIRRPFRPMFTTPHAPELHRFLRDAADAGADDVIIEVSSHALELGRIEGLTFETIAITNITPDHLDFHGSFAQYARAKASLASYLCADGVAFLNGDDPVVTAQLPDFPHKKYFGYGSGRSMRARMLEQQAQYTRWQWLVDERELGEIRLPLAGPHNVMNALAAAGMGLHLGASSSTIIAALEHFVPAERRLQTVDVGHFTILTDVAMNRGSYEAVMSTIEQLGRPCVVVNAVRGNRGTAVNRDIAKVLADWNDKLQYGPVFVSLSESYLAHLPADYRVRPEELAAFSDEAQKRQLPIEVFSELEDAMEAAVSRLPDGGILVILGTFGVDEGLEMALTRLRLRSDA